MKFGGMGASPMVFRATGEAPVPRFREFDSLLNQGQKLLVHIDPLAHLHVGDEIFLAPSAEF